MVAVRAGDVEATLRRHPKARVLLFYGPDQGLVAERARKAAEGAVQNPQDPFQLIRLDGDVVAAHPGRLAEEAGTIGLFGGQRAIWVKPTSRNLAPALPPVLEDAHSDALVIIEAGDLSRSSPLRVLCERSPSAFALPCYADNARDLGVLVDETMQAAGLSIGREARALLLANLGGDRLATRSELAKLSLYARGGSEVTIEDVDTVISDVSALALDDVLDAAFGGDMAGVEEGFRRLAAQGTAASLVLGAALRHAFTLLSSRAEIEGGTDATAVLAGWRGLHFRRKDRVSAQLNRWKTAALLHIVPRLQGDILETRQSPLLGRTIATNALLGIAARAGRQLRA